MYVCFNTSAFYSYHLLTYVHSISWCSDVLPSFSSCHGMIFLAKHSIVIFTPNFISQTSYGRHKRISDNAIESRPTEVGR